MQGAWRETVFPPSGPPRRVQVAGAAVVSGAVSALVVAYHGTGGPRGGFSVEENTIYGPSHLALAIGLAGAGVLLAVVKRQELVVALLGVIGVFGAQLAGVGLVGYRRWPLYWGASSDVVVHHEDLVRRLALLMGALCALTAFASLAVLVARRSFRWQGWTTAVALAAAMVVLVLVPPLIASDGFGTHNSVAAALTYSVPFAGALTLAGLTSRFAALVITAAVAVSAVIAVAGQSMLDLILPFHDAQGLVVGAAVVVALASLLPRPMPAGETQI
jgi:hypothetical protein